MMPTSPMIMLSQQELMNLMMSEAIEGVSAFPADDASLNEWVGTVEGTEGTPYSGLTCASTLSANRADQADRIFISFPADYPMAAPTIKFEPNAAWHRVYLRCAAAR